MALSVRILALCALPSPLFAEALFPNSVASNDLEFIRADDPGACWSLAERGGGRTEMYDPRRDILFVDGALHVDVTYPGQVLRLNIYPEVGDPMGRAAEVADAVARLPVPMRSALRHVNILDGDGAAWEESLGGFFTLYDGLIARRLAGHDLNETVFHEAAHVALDPVIGGDPDWAASQRADGGFVTDYAAAHPEKEDIAESALFAWTMIHHPGRLPPEIEAAVRRIMPNRLDHLGTLMDGFHPPSC